MYPICIKKTDHGNLVAKVKENSLFEFRYCQDADEWRFWPLAYCMKGWTLSRKGRAFPWIYFYELCRVVAFLGLDEPLWKTVNPKVVSGKSYIK
jgi:hypothetical protein